MATLWNLVLVVSLLVQSAPQRCSGVDHGSLELWDVKLISALQIGNDALKRTSENVEEGLPLPEKNNEALKDLQSLLELVMMVKEQNENMDSMKNLLMALHRVKTVAEEIEGVDQQLQNKDEMVRHLEELVSNHTNMEQLLSNKVQVLEKRILEHQQKEKRLEETVLELNNIVAAQKKCPDNELENQEIIRLVQQYSHTKDWDRLRRGLESVLDNSSAPFIQLQRVDYRNNIPLYFVGGYGSTQLVSLLLDAGLPVDTADAGGYALLHGAVSNRQLQLVKLLLRRGGSVDVRDRRGGTPLMHAASLGHLDVVQYLVSAGADTTARDNERRTALDCAKGESDTAIVQYLEQLPH